MPFVPSVSLLNAGTISLAESTGGWSGDSFALEPDIKVEGGNSVACSLTNNGTNEVNFSGSWDLTNTVIRLYMNISFVSNLDAINPIRVGLNGTYFTYFTSNADYNGGWVDLVVHTENFPTTLNNVTQVSVQFITSSKPRNVPANAWFDNWRYSSGILLDSQTSEAVNFTDCAALDKAAVHGVLLDIDGIIFAQGAVQIAAGCNFQSTNETLVFPERNVSASTYTLDTAGACDIAIQGLVCKSGGNAVASVGFSGPQTSFSVRGSTFIGLNNFVVTPSVAVPVFDGNTVADCGPTTLGIPVNACAFSNGTGVTLSTGGALDSCTFTQTPLTLSASNSLNDLNNCTFNTGASDTNAVTIDIGSGTVAAFWNSKSTTGRWIGSPDTINNTNDTAFGCIRVIGSGTLNLTIEAGATVPTIEIDSSATVEVSAGLTTLTITGIPVGAEWRLYDKSATQGLIGVELAGEESSTGGSKTYSYTYSSDNPAVLQVFADGFKEFTRTFTLGANDQTQNTDLTTEENA